jgi:hypothetical protein
MLLSLIIIVGFVGLGITSQTTLDTSTVVLQEVSEHVASEIMSLIDLSSIQGSASLIYKVVPIPDNVNNEGYTLKLVLDDKGWKIVAYMDQYHWKQAEARLNFRNCSSQTCGIIAQVNSGNFTGIQIGSETFRISYGPQISSGTGNARGSRTRMVVWSEVYQSPPTEGNLIRVGIGKLELSS